MNVKVKDFMKDYVLIENGIEFYPVYRYSKVEDGEYKDFVIIKTAEEVKKEYYEIINNLQ